MTEPTEAEERPPREPVLHYRRMWEIPHAEQRELARLGRELTYATATLLDGNTGESRPYTYSVFGGYDSAERATEIIAKFLGDPMDTRQALVVQEVLKNLIARVSAEAVEQERQRMREALLKLDEPIRPSQLRAIGQPENPEW